jgi:hypothetical protein
MPQASTLDRRAPLATTAGVSAGIGSRHPVLASYGAAQSGNRHVTAGNVIFLCFSNYYMDVIQLFFTYLSYTFFNILILLI